MRMLPLPSNSLEKTMIRVGTNSTNSVHHQQIRTYPQIPRKLRYKHEPQGIRYYGISNHSWEEKFQGFER